MAASQPTPDKTKAELKVDIPSKTELLKLANKGKEDVDEPLTPEQNFIGDEAGGSKTSDLTEREQLAVTQGWQSEDDWVASGKDIKQWRPADQWLDRGDFFRTISGLKQEVIKSQQLVSAAFEQGRKLESAKLEKELADLKTERKEARVQGDFETADQIDEKIDALKEKTSAVAPKVPTGQITPPPEFGIFKQRNGWYDTDSALHYAADGIGYEYMRINPNATPADLYWHVEQTMQKRFPELKGKVATLPPSPSGVGSASTKTASTGGVGLAKLESAMDDTERMIMKTLIQTGVFKNKEEYLKEYAAAPRRQR